MNDLGKLLDAIEHYLNRDVEMDFMAIFSSLIGSKDSSVRCVSEVLYYLSSQEYPDFRREFAVRSFVEDIKTDLVNGGSVDKSSILTRIHGDRELKRLFACTDRETMVNGRFAIATVAILIVLAIYLFFKA